MAMRWHQLHRARFYSPACALAESFTTVTRRVPWRPVASLGCPKHASAGLRGADRTCRCCGHDQGLIVLLLPTGRQRHADDSSQRFLRHWQLRRRDQNWEQRWLIDRRIQRHISTVLEVAERRAVTDDYQTSHLSHQRGATDSPICIRILEARAVGRTRPPSGSKSTNLLH